MPQGPSDRTLKILFAQSQNRCAAPDCDNPVIARATSLDGPAPVAQIAHIIARSSNGPRGDVNFPPEQLHEEPNLILLCGHHHALVDAQGSTFTVDELRRWKRAVLEDLQRRPHRSSASDLSRTQCPYPGLESIDDQDLLFGRDRVVEDCCRALQSDQVTVLLGDSGTGKSSVVLAGVVPTRTQERGESPVKWETRLLELVGHPGHESPLHVISVSFNALGIAPDAETVLSSTLAGGAERLLVIVDQLEDLLSFAPEATRVSAWIESLVATGKIEVMCCLRSDFFADYQRSGLHRLAKQIELDPLESQELEEAVRGPARKSGTAIEDTLVAAILHDAASEGPGALPSLALTLRQLWVDREGDTITLDAYARLGGLSGAVARHAECTIERLPTLNHQDLAKRIMAELVVNDRIAANDADSNAQHEWSALRPSGMRYLARPRPASDLRRLHDNDSLFAEVVDALVKSRLLTAGGRDSQVLGLSHLALVEKWPSLQALVDNRQAIDAMVRSRSLEWDSHTRARHSLLNRHEIGLVRRWERSNGGQLDRRFGLLGTDAEFLAQSRRAYKRQQLLRTTALVTALLLVASLLVSWSLTISAKDLAVVRAQQALSRQLAATAAAQADVRIDQALLLAVEAYKTSPTIQAEAALISVAARAKDLRSAVFPPGRHEFLHVATNADGHVLVWSGVNTYSGSTDCEASVVASGRQQPTNLCAAVGLALNGAGSVAAIAGTSVVLYDVNKQEVIRSLPAAGQVAFSPDGQLVAVGGTNGISFWNTATAASAAPNFALSNGSEVTQLVFNPDGQHLVALVGTQSGTTAPVTWDVVTLRVSDAQLLSRIRLPINVQLGANDPTSIVLSEDGSEVGWSVDYRIHISPTATLNDEAIASQGSVVGLGATRLAITPAPSPSADLQPWTEVDLVDPTGTTAHSPLVVPFLAPHVIFLPDGRHVIISGVTAEATSGILTFDTSMDSDPTPTNAFLNGQGLLSPDGTTSIITSAPIERTTSFTTAYLNGQCISADSRTLIPIGASRLPLTLGTGMQPSCAFFSPAGRKIVAVGQQGDRFAVTVRDAATLTPDGPALVTSVAPQLVAVSDDSRTVATQTGSRLTIQNASGLHTLEGSGSSNELVLSPDGRLLASDADNGLIVWDTVRDRVAIRLPGSGLSPIRFSSDGRILLVANGEGFSDLGLYRVAATAHALTNVQSVTPGTAFGATEFSPSGRLIAGLSDGQIQLWDSESGSRLAVFPVGAASQLGFGSSALVVAGAHGYKVFDTNASSLVTSVCATLARNLSPGEWTELVGPDVPFHATCAIP